MYMLTEEGKKYLIEGMPENRLIGLLTKPMKVSEAKALCEKNGIDFGIALQWTKQNNWVEMEKGVLYVRKRPAMDKLKDALAALEKGKKIDETILTILLKRNLVSEAKDDAIARAQQFVGKSIGNLDPSLIETGLWKNVELRSYNVEAIGKRIYPGRRQAYNKFLVETKQKLAELGFKEMKGPNIETEFWNFDALFQAQNHPSRDWTQTYRLFYPKLGTLPDKKIVDNVREAHEKGVSGSTGWQYKWSEQQAMQLMPRAHTTASSARMLAKLSKLEEREGKFFSIARCYRPDIIDATHAVEFNQLEGIIVGKTLTFRELLGLLKNFAIEIAGASEVKFYPDYYPFTEPSVQMAAKHPKLGWIEFGGAGIFREELTAPLGINEIVLAWGLGIDRLFMCKAGINDIRDLFTQNISLLRNVKTI
ncbi:MAG: phenylalanine--tRNA ligase subunit alpha [Candidatus Aenigmatarchaeota archaeon]